MAQTSQYTPAARTNAAPHQQAPQLPLQTQERINMMQMQGSQGYPTPDGLVSHLPGPAGLQMPPTGPGMPGADQQSHSHSAALMEALYNQSQASEPPHAAQLRQQQHILSSPQVSAGYMQSGMLGGVPPAGGAGQTGGAMYLTGRETPVMGPNLGLPRNYSSLNLISQSLFRDVYRPNLSAELELLRSFIPKCRYVSISTELPGIIARPIGEFRSTSDYHYQTMRCNADLVNIVQLGLTLWDANGNRPEGSPNAWQFNFRFDVEEEMFSAESLDALRRIGFDFQRSKEYGIDRLEFAQFLYDSGLLMMDNVSWISFHGGYDYGFLTSLLINRELPAQEENFLWWVKKLFPSHYDVKYISRTLRATFKGGVDELAEELKIPSGLAYFNPELAMIPGVASLPVSQKAGGQSLMTGACFFELLRLDMGEDFTKTFDCKVFGLDGTPEELDGNGNAKSVKAEGESEEKKASSE